jgi:hypothetical protein
MIVAMLPPAPSVDVALDSLWKDVRVHLDPRDDGALGIIRVGTSDKYEKPWAQTNDGEDRVNLTLELKPEQLELDLVGWKETQSNAFKDWLQSVPGEKAVNALAGYEVVAFARRAYKKTPGSRPWWQDETVVELGTCSATAFNAGWVFTTVMGMNSPKEEKPAFHIRRAWSRPEAEALGDSLPSVIAIEVERLLPILREIWAR